jgi:hypothetical protein
MKEIKLLFYALSLFFLSILALNFHQLSLIFIALSFLFFSPLFFKNKTLTIYILSLSVSIIYFVIYTFITFYETNSLFLPGGDDEFFYTTSLQLFDNGFDSDTLLSGGRNLSSANYLGYLYLNNIIINILDFIPFFEVDILSFRFIKYLLTALIPVFIYKIFKNTVFRLNNKGILILILFPQVIFFNYSLIRSSYISLLFCILVYVILYFNNRTIKYLFVVMIIALTAFFRDVSALFLLLFLIFYNLKFEKKNILFSLSIILLTIYSSFFLFSQTALGVKLSNIQNAFIELSISTNSSSLGLSVLLSKNPLMFPIKLVYIALSPIPPKFIYNINFINFINFIGNLSWYIISLGCAVYYVKNRNKFSDKISIPLFLCFFSSTIIILNTTMNPRHIAFMYPFFVPIGIYGLNSLNVAKKTFMFITSGIVAIILFIFLKIL